ncbi:unnamed protein product [Sphenostylis stenocarpa]|uniref:Transmembrane protein n=1 Tax=Sphenostylis stenocarpa TaxID=92480 RepID=A0AA86TA47_9FABA|nr:unnamed protein product [Sphenostylis stenocarpa]
MQYSETERNGYDPILFFLSSFLLLTILFADVSHGRWPRTRKALQLILPLQPPAEAQNNNQQKINSLCSKDVLKLCKNAPLKWLIKGDSNHLCEISILRSFAILLEK